MPQSGDPKLRDGPVERKRLPVAGVPPDPGHQTNAIVSGSTA